MEMDAAKVFGALLSQRIARGGGGGQVLSQVLEGIAANSQGVGDPRFSPANQGHFESTIRDSMSRYGHAGGQLPPSAAAWAGRQGFLQLAPGLNYPEYQRPPVVQQVPPPRHHGGHDHPCGLGGNQRAEILIRAMVMAAQADGQLDAAEQDQIVQKLQPLDPAEVQFLRREFATRHDLHQFAHAVPPGMEYEVYSASLMAINLDTRAEANYLRSLAECLRIQPQVCNQLHQRYGCPTLY